MLMTPYLATIGVMTISFGAKDCRSRLELGSLGTPHVGEERH